MDGNIERLISRYFGIETPLPAAKTEIVVAYQSLLPVGRPSDFLRRRWERIFQALFARQNGPDVAIGVVSLASCIASAEGIAERIYFDKTTPKLEKPLRRAIALCCDKSPW